MNFVSKKTVTNLGDVVFLTNRGLGLT